MLQTALEQRLRYNQKGIAYVEEAFAWGPRLDRIDKRGREGRVTSDLSDDKKCHHDNLNGIFRMDSPESETRPITEYPQQASARRWLAIRNAKMNEFISVVLDNLRHNSMNTVFNRKCLRDPQFTPGREKFELHMLGYLRSLHASLDKPLLTQLEENAGRDKISNLEVKGVKLSAGESEKMMKIWGETSSLRETER